MTIQEIWAEYPRRDLFDACVCVCLCVSASAFSSGPAAHTSASSTCLHQSSAVCGRRRHQLHHQHHVRTKLHQLFSKKCPDLIFSYFLTHLSCVFYLVAPALSLTLTRPCTPRPQLPSIMKVSQLQALRPPPLALLLPSL